MKITLGSEEPVYRLRARTQLLHVENTLFLMLGERRAKICPFNDLMRRFLHLLATGATWAQVQAFADIQQGEQQGKIVEECLTYLLQAGFIEQQNLEAPPDLDPLDLARFDRLLHFFLGF